MKQSPPSRAFTTAVSRWFFAVCIISVLYLTYLLFQPYLLHIFLAVALAVICQPFYKLLSKWFRGKHSLAAMVVCLVVGSAVITAMFFMATAITGQALSLYNTVTKELASDQMQQTIGQGLGRLKPLFESLHDKLGISQGDLVNYVGEAVRKISGLLYSNLTGLVKGFTTVVIGFVLVIFVTFYLLRDGSSLAERALALSPLPSDTNHAIVDNALEALKDTLRGSIILALLQGAAGGVIFWSFGVPNAMFWGTVMVFASVVPLVGTSLVFIPAGIFLAVTGSPYQAFFLAGICLSAQLVGDNILRPRFISGKTELHPLLTFFSILGGLGLFGLAGLILGPLVLALLMALLSVYTTYFQTSGKAAWQGGRRRSSVPAEVFRRCQKRLNLRRK